MKLRALVLVTTVLFISCSNDKKSTEIQKKESTLKSDFLLQSSAVKPFSSSPENDIVYLTLSGDNILESTATLQVLNSKGEELHCETFLAKTLIQSEYKTANSTLKEAHIRSVVKEFFSANVVFQKNNDNAITRL